MPSDRAHQAAVDAVVTWLDKFQCVVVGPGLGRDALVMHTVAQVGACGGGVWWGCVVGL